jgi:ribonucleotide monophosphatase NagD (HAD superfamily)
LVAGKPSAMIVRMALDQLGLPAAKCLMVGDRLETDIAMGHRSGMSTALVLTGVTRRADLNDSVVQPDFILESVVEVP